MANTKIDVILRVLRETENKGYAVTIEKEIKKLKHQLSDTEKELIQQCKQTKTFGDDLLFFQKQKANIRYELKLKEYREQIVKLERRLSQAKEVINEFVNKHCFCTKLPPNHQFYQRPKDCKCIYHKLKRKLSLTQKEEINYFI